MSRYRNILAAIAATCCLAVHAGYFGAGTNRNATGVTYGTNAVTAIYSGSNLVWSAETDVLDGLVAWWPLNGDLADASGNGNDGTSYGAYATNIEGVACYWVSGHGEYISADKPLVSSAPFSVSFWSRSLGSQPHPYFCVLSQGHTVSDGFALQNGYPGANLYVTFGHSGSIWTADSGVNLAPSNGWRHVCVVYDGAGVQNYVDAVPTSSSDVPLTIGEYSFSLGRDTVNADEEHRSFRGVLRQMRVYGTALSSNDVSVIYERYK